MSIWSDLEARAKSDVASAETSFKSWAWAHKGWLTTTIVAHILGWVFGKLL